MQENAAAGDGIGFSALDDYMWTEDKPDQKKVKLDHKLSPKLEVSSLGHMPYFS